MRTPIISAVIVTSLVLAGCTEAETASPPEDISTATAASPSPAASAAGSPAPGSSDGPGATKGGDGSAIVLSPLSQEDIAGADLPPELGCAFTTDTGSLVVAKGFVGGDDPARGVVKVGDYVERVVARGDGYDAMSEDGEFTGKGLTLDVEVTGDEIPMFESRKFPAELIVMRADGAERVIPGEWTCGP